MTEEGREKNSSSVRTALGAALLWTAALAVLLILGVRGEHEQCSSLALTQTSAFFQEFLMTRFWNAMHRGVYVEVTAETQPNPYLKDDPQRDVFTTGGMPLTKLNPAYMTRQIADIAKQRNEVRFHLTGLDPINPQNEPDAWEKQVLSELNGNGERITLTTMPGGEQVYRYLSLLAMEQECLGCHEKYGDKLGSKRGGISVTIPALPLLELRDVQVRKLTLSYGSIWLLGLVAIVACALHMGSREKERSSLIEQLRQSLQGVKKLSGLLPICCSCKSIRDDKGYWKEVEHYMGEHADVQFTHGICPNCTKKLYPELHEEEGGRLSLRRNANNPGTGG